jgi:serine/threonine-protein kinase RsbW
MQFIVFSDKPREPFGETILSLAIPTQLALKTPLVFRMVKELSARGCLDSATAQQAELCFEEAIINAMLHGNKLDPARKVRVTLCADAERWGAIVEDEGDGFKPSDIPNPDDIETLLNETGRGIRLMDGYLDELIYNQRGNEVMMIRRRPQQSATAESQPVAAAEETAAPIDSAAGPINVSRQGDADIVHVNSRRLNDENVAALREAVHATTNARLVLDLSAVTFISSSGIGALVHIHKVMAQRQGKLALAGLQPAVKDNLAAVKILAIFSVFPDRESALGGTSLRNEGRG